MGIHVVEGIEVTNDIIMQPGRKVDGVDISAHDHSGEGQGGTVSKSSVGLGNVTNDAQLKRAGNDFTTFDSKSTPIDKDVFLIEDSADSYNKKSILYNSILKDRKFSVYYDGMTYVNCGSGSSLNLTGPFTIECWIYRSVEASNCYIFRRGSWGNGGYALRISDTGYLYAEINSPSGNVYWGPWGLVIPLTTWYHVVVSLDSSGTLRFFHNGVLRATYTGVSFPASISTDAVIGYGDSSPYFVGMISELRISNYARYTVNFLPPIKRLDPDIYTVGLWHFDEGSGSITTLDSSGNGNHGTLTGGGTWSDGFKLESPSYAADNTESSTTSTSYVDKLVHTFTPPLSGLYTIQWSIELRGTAANCLFRLYDGSDVLNYSRCYRADYQAVSGFVTIYFLENSSYTFRMQFASATSGSSVSVRNARMLIRRAT